MRCVGKETAGTCRPIEVRFVSNLSRQPAPVTPGTTVNKRLVVGRCGATATDPAFRSIARPTAVVEVIGYGRLHRTAKWWHMAYREFEPPEFLREWVECFWIYREDDRDLQRITPDGRCEIVVQLEGSYREVHGTTEKVQPPALFAGQFTRPLHLQGFGPTWSVCARLRPAATGLFLHTRATAATDRRIDLVLLDPTGIPNLLAGIRQADQDGDRIAALADYIVTRIHGSPIRLDTRVALACSLFEDFSFPSPGEVAGKLGLGLRTLQRLFLLHVGVSPQTYASIIRFRRIFDELASGSATLSEAAHAAGYSDHPQMAREFQRLLGCTATQFMKERNQLAAALTRARASGWKSS